MQYVIILLLSFSSFASTIERYPSGLLRTFEAGSAEISYSNEMRSIAQFKKENFVFLTDKHSWKEVLHFKDNTHSHRTEALYYQGRRVSGHFLKTHYNNRGYLEYASSSLTKNIEGFTVPVSRESQTYWKEKIREEFESTYQQKLNGGVLSDPVIYLDPNTGEQHSAIEIHLVNHFPLYVRHLIMDEMTGKILSEKQNSRSIDVSAKAFIVSPYNNNTASTVTLSVTSSDKLINDNLYVRREENSSSPRLVDITPGTYASTATSLGNAVDPGDPDYYAATCTGGSADCPNQAFDGVNVYYHLSRYRTRIGSYLAQLGASITFPSEPIPVMINALTLKGYDTGVPTNNAQYVQGCRADGSMPRCMVFFRPSALSEKSSVTNCGIAAQTKLYDLAREALVVAHEYQHYVTDTITNIVFGCDSDNLNCAVGDALHEAFSDYLGASYASETANREVTLVGQYGLKNCTSLQRELNTLKVYEESEATRDSHVGGLTWASGYWKLRTEYGIAVIDKLILKSLFYLPTSPSFADSVESLVKADNALYEGVHSERIRRLFYDELKIIGGTTSAFRDSARGIVEMGTKGCSGVTGIANPLSGIATLLLLIFWFVSTKAIVKRSVKKE